MNDEPRVVIIGGGFGGLCAVRGLVGAPVSVTLIDNSETTCQQTPNAEHRTADPATAACLDAHITRSVHAIEVSVVRDRISRSVS